MSKKAMMELLAHDDWKGHLTQLLSQDTWGCQDVMRISSKTIERVSHTPEQGWLPYLYSYTIGTLFPQRAQEQETEGNGEYATGRLLLFQIIRTLLELKRKGQDFDYSRDFALLTWEECEEYDSALEYQRLLEIMRDRYIHEFMCIGAEI
ncbi:MAG TPA: hypothetical protein PKW40_03925, partial [Bacillota bacterium]|nr:hypothetical protein [Bacillota bacterium]